MPAVGTVAEDAAVGVTTVARAAVGVTTGVRIDGGETETAGACATSTVSSWRMACPAALGCCPRGGSLACTVAGAPAKGASKTVLLPIGNEICAGDSFGVGGALSEAMDSSAKEASKDSSE